MPGLGFARVPAKQRAAWRSFLATYMEERAQLRVLVHLVDGQVGPLQTDEELMEMVAAAQRGRERPGGEGWAYAVVLTKVDKRRKRGATERAERAVRDALERAGCPAQTRVLRTSAKSRLGRDEVWRLLRCVVLPGEGIEES